MRAEVTRSAHAGRRKTGQWTSETMFGAKSKQSRRAAPGANYIWKFGLAKHSVLAPTHNRGDCGYPLPTNVCSRRGHRLELPMKTLLLFVAIAAMTLSLPVTAHDCVGCKKGTAHVYSEGYELEERCVRNAAGRNTGDRKVKICKCSSSGKCKWEWILDKERDNGCSP